MTEAEYKKFYGELKVAVDNHCVKHKMLVSQGIDALVGILVGQIMTMMKNQGQECSEFQALDYLSGRLSELKAGFQKHLEEQSLSG